jgi:hypothetical protein
MQQRRLLVPTTIPLSPPVCHVIVSATRAMCVRCMSSWWDVEPTHISLAVMCDQADVRWVDSLPASLGHVWCLRYTNALSAALSSALATKQLLGLTLSLSVAETTGAETAEPPRHSPPHDLMCIDGLSRVRGCD